MADFAPQYNLFAIIGRLKKIGGFLFWGIFVLSIYPCLIEYFPVLTKLADWANIFNIISISLFFIIEIVVGSILIPMAEHKRRNDFIDNSFGSRFELLSSVGYFSNDTVDFGEYKAAVNLFENCFFTYSQLRIITVNKILLPSVTLILVTITAYFGFREVPFALSLLQVLFSGTLLGGLIKHLILINRIDLIQENWIVLFQTPDFASNTILHKPDIFRNWLRYESLISRFPLDFPDGLFEKNDGRLAQEWNQIKIKYSIH